MDNPDMLCDDNEPPCTPAEDVPVNVEVKVDENVDMDYSQQENNLTSVTPSTSSSCNNEVPLYRSDFEAIIVDEEKERNDVPAVEIGLPDHTSKKTLRCITETAKEDLPSTSGISDDYESRKSFLDLPISLMKEIFDYLDLPERIRCSYICKLMDEHVHNPGIWGTILPTQWSLCDWSNVAKDGEELIDMQTDLPEMFRKGYYYMGIFKNVRVLNDEDDIEPELLSSPTVKFELKILKGLTQHLLPKAGQGIRKFVGAASRCLSNNMLREILKCCPNLKYLDVSFTRIDANAFKDIASAGACAKLTHVDLHCCPFLEDEAVFYLAACWFPVTDVTDTSGSSHPYIPVGTKKFCTSIKEDQITGLLSLNLAGCRRLTNRSIEALGKAKKVTSAIEELDVSGCCRLGGFTLREFAHKCPELNPARLWYCNNIEDGPPTAVPNGCEKGHCRNEDCELLAW